MLIILNQHDLCKAVYDTIQGVQADNVIVDVGIRNGVLVGIVAIDEAIPGDLKQPHDFAQLAYAQEQAEEQLVDKAVSLQDPSLELEEEKDDTNNPPADGSAPQKRKRRTKAEIEADNSKLAEQQAQAETPVEATEAVPAQEQAVEPTVEPVAENNPFAEMETPATSTGAGFNEIAAEAELDNTPPFDIDEGAVVRAEAELLPEAKEVPADENDPFANMGVSTAGDELFAQPGNVAVTTVTKQQDGFVEPAVENNDPFASFN